MRIGIISAMAQENDLLDRQIGEPQKVCYANREYTQGSWLNHEIVLVFSRWGKVAAAITATHLIAEFKVDAIIFTGVAGACALDVQIGDVVVADCLVQHDMDATPFFPRHEIPLIGLSYFQMDRNLKNNVYEATSCFLNRSFKNILTSDLNLFGITTPKIHQGLIATGDKFFASKKESQDLLSRLPQALCVEMEGAAVAQVCYEYQVPCAVIRTISDSADESSPEHFDRFISSISSPYSLGILQELLPKLAQAEVANLASV